jgi:hypoxanthine-DNA glycosylase
MPSVSSLGQQQYYAHPQNHFWPITAELFDFAANQSYEARCLSLLKKGVILWDVIGSCQRQGSLDANIIKDSIRINDIPKLLSDFPTVQKIGCNGGMAQRLFTKHTLPQLDAQPLQIVPLTSSSPANAKFRLAQKVALWRESLLN